MSPDRRSCLSRFGIGEQADQQPQGTQRQEGQRRLQPAVLAPGYLGGDVQLLGQLAVLGTGVHRLQGEGDRVRRLLSQVAEIEQAVRRSRARPPAGKPGKDNCQGADDSEAEADQGKKRNDEVQAARSAEFVVRADNGVHCRSSYSNLNDKDDRRLGVDAGGPGLYGFMGAPAKLTAWPFRHGQMQRVSTAGCDLSVLHRLERLKAARLPELFCRHSATDMRPKAAAAQHRFPHGLKRLPYW